MATETIDWEAYEYGLEGVDGEIIEVSDLDTLRQHKRRGEKIVFRAIYVTDWIPFIGKIE